MFLQSTENFNSYCVYFFRLNLFLLPKMALHSTTVCLCHHSIRICVLMWLHHFFNISSALPVVVSKTRSHPWRPHKRMWKKELLQISILQCRQRLLWSLKVWGFIRHDLRWIWLDMLWILTVTTILSLWRIKQYIRNRETGMPHAQAGEIGVSDSKKKYSGTRRFATPL